MVGLLYMAFAVVLGFMVRAFVVAILEFKLGVECRLELGLGPGVVSCMATLSLLLLRI